MTTHSTYCYAAQALNRRQIVVGLVLTTTISGGRSTGAEPAVDLAAVRAKAPQLETWLRSMGISDSIEIVKVRRAPHPVQDETLVVHLETRWRKPISSRDAAINEFAAFAAGFAGTTGDTFHQKLFFKFNRICGLPLRTTAVHVHVADSDIASYLDAEGKLVMMSSDLRMVRATTTLNLTAPAVSVSARKKPNSDAVIDLVAAHYSKRKARFRKQEIDPSFVSFVVENLRNEVISGEGLWERIEGALLMSVDEDRLRLYLNLDGRFAAGGLGTVPPAETGFKDMDPDYTKRLTEYANELLQIWRPKIVELIK